MTEERSRFAWEAAQQALSRIDGASPVEAALVRALAKRYAWPAPEDRTELDRVYDEPPAWMLPVRHALGALLMSAGRYAEAETVYREDLERNRDNGWALTGLQLALEAQGLAREAGELAPRLARAFNTADTRPTSSCFCEP